MSENSLTKFELKSVFSLASVLVMRMVGLFMILPVLALYTDEFTGATPYLIGLALGIYGLTQAILQVPFGAASDRWGRKPLIMLGLIIFAVGSVIAAEATSIFGVILGRALQGAGAISAVILAMVGDLIRESQRPKSMAIVGMAFGFSFVLALTLGPVLAQLVGIRGVFWIAFCLACAAMLLVVTAVPAKSAQVEDNVTEQKPVGSKRAIFGRQMLMLYSGTMTIHAAITALFLAFPLFIVENFEIARADMWKVYVPVVLASALLTVPFIRYSSRSKRANDVMMVSGIILVVAHGVLYFGSAGQLFTLLVAGLWLFFVGFNTLEALLPSITVSRVLSNMRGTTMGVFNSCTFIGAFLGGVIGGLIYTRHGASGVFLFSGIVILIWIANTAIFRRIAA